MRMDDLQDLLCMDTVLVHFDPALQIVISCDAFDVEIGAVQFHLYNDGSECPITNVSKLQDTYGYTGSLYLDTGGVTYLVVPYTIRKEFLLVLDLYNN